MKIFILFFILLFCNQIDIKKSNKEIIKKYILVNSKKHLIEKFGIYNNKPVYKINYSGNGWQILDSLSYYYIDSNMKCYFEYKAIYYTDKKLIQKYEFIDSSCLETKKFSMNLLNQIIKNNSQIDDYISFLYDIIEKESIDSSSNDGFYKVKFNNGFIPSIFLNYGLDYDEKLFNFKFFIKNNKYIADNYLFKNFTINRKFKYINNSLSKVEINRIQIKNKDTVTFVETFEYVN